MLGYFLKVMFWYEIIFILLLATLIPLLSGGFILFLLIKKQKSPFINKFRLIGVHYLVSFALTCAVVFFPAIYKSSINALNSGYWAIAVECITIPIFYLTYRYRIMSGDKNMDSNHRDNVQ